MIGIIIEDKRGYGMSLYQIKKNLELYLRGDKREEENMEKNETMSLYEKLSILNELFIGIGIILLGAFVWGLGFIFSDIPNMYTMCATLGTIIMFLSIFYGLFQM